MSSFPRIRMRSRIKVYNADKTAYSSGTVMLRQGVYDYVIRFDDKTERAVCLKDTNTWEFEQNRTRTHGITPRTPQHNTQSANSSPIAKTTSQLTTPTEDLHNNLPSPPITVSASKKDDIGEENKSSSQVLHASIKYKIDVAPGENLPHHNIDWSPKPTIRKLPPRMTSEKRVKKSLEPLQFTRFKTKSVPPRKRNKRVTFGPDIILNRDIEKAGTGIRTSKEPAANKTQGSASHASEVVVKRSVAEAGAGISISKEPAKKKTQGAASNASEVVVKRSVAQPNTSDRLKGSIREGGKITKEMERSVSNLTTDFNEKENNQKPLRRSERRKKGDKAKKDIATKRAQRISSLRKRDPYGRVAKVTDHGKNSSPQRSGRASQQTDHGGEIRNQVSNEPTSIALESPEQSNISDGKTDGSGDEESVGKDDEEKAINATETEDECQAEEDCSGRANHIEEMDIKDKLAESVEEIATKKTQEIIDNLGSKEDLFVLFPKLNYTALGNRYYGEQVDVMGEMITRRIPDATRIAEFYSEPGEEISDTVALFVELQMSDAARRLNEIRISEINKAVERRREEVKGKPGPSPAGVQSARNSASG